MIFTISLIILIVFTLPLTEESIKSTMDISDVLNAKSDLSKISQAIKEVYGEGQGSKHTVKLHVSKKIKVDVAENHISSTIPLKNNQNKNIYEHFNSNLEKTSLVLGEGENIIVVEWPVNSNCMIIYPKYY